MGRFVNADVYLSTGQGVIGFNLYSYCLNNAVNRVDISGSMSAVADVLNNSPWLLGLAVLDGPLPIGDIIAAIGCIILLAITVDEIEEKIVAAPKVGETAEATGGPENTPTPKPTQTPDQKALKEIGKEAIKSNKNGKPITYDEAQIIDEWAEEYGVNQHHQAEPGSGQHWPGGNYMNHTHVYNMHIPYVYSIMY